MEYMIGCNFWDSKSGTDMWKNWDEDSVRADLVALSENGVRYLRVFPNWRDFQPLIFLEGWRGKRMEYRMTDDRPFENEFGIDPVMIERFEKFCDIAAENNIKFIVSIVTGWMSGRLFVPPALQGRNPITDPEVLKWEILFARGMVRFLKHRKEIVYWDLGNECNCLGEAPNNTAAWVWTSSIRNAILSEDNTRQIMSGMHGLSVDPNVAPWTIQDQGQLTDVLCPHPYPSPTVGGDVDKVNSLRTTLIPTAQVVYYSGVGGKPAMIQETGTFNDMVASKEVSAQFVRVNILSGWAHGSLGYLWWCGMEHLHLGNPPYSWSMVERELGLVFSDRSPKPVAIEMKKMTELFETLNLGILPKRDTNTVCVTTNEQSNYWHIAATSYVLSKQAGLEMEFCHYTQKLPEAKIYIVPSLTAWAPLGKYMLDQLIEKAEQGARVLFTVDTGMLTTFERLSGLKSAGMQKDSSKHIMNLDGESLPFSYEQKYLLSSIGAEVLSEDKDGTVIFSRNKIGKGYIYLLNFPLEKIIWNEAEVFTDRNRPYFKIYSKLCEGMELGKIAVSKNPDIGVTQHRQDDGSYIVVAINYTDKPLVPELDFMGHTATVLYGKPDIIDACDAAIFKVEL